jgi:hypothetical protein
MKLLKYSYIRLLKYIKLIVMMYSILICYSILIISRLCCVYITTLIVRRHRCQFLVASLYVGGVYKHRLRFI